MLLSGVIFCRVPIGGMGEEKFGGDGRDSRRRKKKGGDWFGGE